MIKITKNIIIANNNSKDFSADVFYKPDGQQKPIVIFSHGFKGFKDWGHFNYVAEKFAENDFFFIKFNFSHNGTTLEHPDQCTEVSTFGENNFSKEIHDLGVVIDWIVDNNDFSKNIDISKIYLMGHSRGGAISILKTAEDNRIKKLVTWAAVADFDKRYTPEMLQFWKNNGKVETTNSRTGQVLPMYYQMHEDYVQNKDKLNIPNASKRLKIPFLIIHGTKDPVIPYEEAKDLNNWCKSSQLELINDAGHTFEAAHPFNSAADLHKNTLMVIEKSISFFKQ